MQIKFSLVVLVVVNSLFCGCSSSPKRPSTNTPAPSLNASQEQNRQIYNDVTDAKGSIRKARNLADIIDAKVIKWDASRKQ